MGPSSRVLVVEDDEVIRELLDLALSGEGYNVLTAPHGAIALDLIKSNGQPDVIFLDMYMPVMDGLEFSRAYSLTPGPHAPIVLLTAADQRAFQACEMRADGYLSKPFDLEELVQLASQYSPPPLFAA